MDSNLPLEVRQRIIALREQAHRLNAQADELEWQGNDNTRIFSITCREVARALNITPDRIASRTKQQQVAFARQLLCYVLRNITQLSTTEMGQLVNRDHSTVIHAIKKMRRRITAQPEFGATVQLLTAAIRDRLKLTDSRGGESCTTA